MIGSVVMFAFDRHFWLKSSVFVVSRERSPLVLSGTTCLYWRVRTILYVRKAMGSAIYCILQIHRKDQQHFWYDE